MSDPSERQERDAESSRSSPPEETAPERRPGARAEDPAGSAAGGPATERATPDGDAPGRAAPEAPFTQLVGRVTVGVLAILFGIFAVANSQFVSFNWIFGGTTAEFTDGGEHLRGGVPLIVLLLASFVVGAVVGWFATWWRARRAHEPESG